MILGKSCQFRLESGMVEDFWIDNVFRDLAARSSQHSIGAQTSSIVGAWDGVRRACSRCRAGFTGRGIQVARATHRTILASDPDPRRSLGRHFDA